MQETLVLIKPDAVAKEVWFRIMEIYERNGLQIFETKIFPSGLPLAMARTLYADHRKKDFYNDLLTLMTNGAVIALCIRASYAVSRVRAINGATDPMKADDFTVRKLYGTDGCRNAVHASANVSEAERELKIIFSNKYPSYVAK